MAKRSPISATGEHLFVYFVSALLNGRLLLTVSALSRWNLETFMISFETEAGGVDKAQAFETKIEADTNDATEYQLHDKPVPYL